MPNTVHLHRVLTTSPEKVYRAFLEADALAKWLPPNGFACTVHHLEPKVGGTHRMSFRNFTTGHSHAFGGQYVELVPGERLRYTDKFDDPNLPGEMQVTVTEDSASGSRQGPRDRIAGTAAIRRRRLQPGCWLSQPAQHRAARKRAPP
jgi:uncharacterized protein YndB with AHSA1/START domain